MDKSALDSDLDKKKSCAQQSLKLYYPRDISALRGAYQTSSIFNAGTSAQPSDVQRRNLPADLADPAGKVHDSIRSYGGNQTPLTQEAFLIQLVAALRELHAQYVILRSSNILDQLFLTKFLRQTFPDVRLVILSSDLLFARERGAPGLSGALTLSTYPEFPLARDWTEDRLLPAADRVFSSDTSEGTYVALRLLLNSDGFKDREQDAECFVVAEDDSRAFLPRITCTGDSPIPDYSPPYWTRSNDCSRTKTGVVCHFPGPPTWLSVVNINRFWPVAALRFGTKPTNSRW